jgi:hypothetical protein
LENSLATIPEVNSPLYQSDNDVMQDTGDIERLRPFLQTLNQTGRPCCSQNGRTANME